MSLKYIILLIFLPLCIFSNEYEIGYGYPVNDNLHLGGYISTEYTAKETSHQFILDDIALLVYGNFTPKISYFMELEASALYIYDFNTNVEDKKIVTHIERAYLDYGFSNIYNLRIGKQITPIGYWNYEPINVLRDTTSNPIYSFKMFPKLLSGIDLYGNLIQNNHLSYHLFIQKNKDIDEEAMNIKSDYFYGLSLKYDEDSYLSLGGSIGRYKIRYIDEIVDIFQLNAKSVYGATEIQTEFAYKTILDNQKSQSVHALIGYIQGKYQINDNHAIVGRYEYINDTEINHIKILGYSYRPIYAISLKAEYQWHTKAFKDKALLSFSILF